MVKIQVFVKTLTGGMIGPYIDVNDDVLTLKEKIYGKIDVLPCMQNLVYMGMSLENGRKLCDYNIQKDSTIHLVLNLRGA